MIFFCLGEGGKKVIFEADGSTRNGLEMRAAETVKSSNGNDFAGGAEADRGRDAVERAEVGAAVAVHRATTVIEFLDLRGGEAKWGA